MIKLVHFVVILSTIVTVSAETPSKVKLCTTDDSLDGKCVPSHHCKNSETTGEGMFDIRLDQCEESEICCSLVRLFLFNIIKMSKKLINKKIFTVWYEK